MLQGGASSTLRLSGTIRHALTAGVALDTVRTQSYFGEDARIGCTAPPSSTYGDGELCGTPCNHTAAGEVRSGTMQSPVSRVGRMPSPAWEKCSWDAQNHILICSTLGKEEHGRGIPAVPSLGLHPHRVGTAQRFHPSLEP